MGLIGYVCPPGSPTVGNKNLAQWCFNGCPHQCVSPVLLGAMYDAARTNYHIGAYISSSMLAGSSCPRQTYYERHRDFYDAPERTFWPFRGTIIHNVIEQSVTVNDYGWLQEMRMAVPIKYPNEPAPVLDDLGMFTGAFSDTESLVVMLGGTCDAYNPLLTPPELHDFKSLGDDKCGEFVKAGKAKDDWATQLNIYRWLIANTSMPGDIRATRTQLGLADLEYYPAPEVLTIQGIAMMSIPRTGRTSLARVRGKKGTYRIDPVPVVPLDEIEAFIREAVYKWYRWLILKELPPVVPAELKWMCVNCPFNGANDPDEPCWPEYERAQLDDALLENTAVDEADLDSLL